ncbi:MAG TPA: PKD domain-containing protein [Candidatus Acidoferrales bacterium]|nr:PKD domain-containing protein [Candidatus Acidoferrales bacterium]
MKHRSYVFLPFLLTTVFLFAIVPGFSIVTHAGIAGATDEALQVWFNGAPLLITTYPMAYQFTVAAMTSNGLWITNLHWDFGDNSTLDVPFSAQSQVSDMRFHAYSQSGLYTVSVTAYDNGGNSQTAEVTVNWASPVQNCQNSLNSVEVNVTPDSTFVQVGQSVTFTASPSGSYAYVWVWQQEGSGTNLQHGSGIGNPFKFTPTRSGNYDVWITENDGCGILVVKLVIHSTTT